MQFSLAQVCSAAGAQPRSAAGALVQGWSIDSRTVSPGDLFFAIEGEHLDGHQFVAQAIEKGALAAVVSKPAAVEAKSLIYVHDTLKALQDIALWARRTWGKPVVAVTGSAGKTTTKDLIAALLAVRMPVGKTAGNFNNHIGLPLSLLRMPDNAEAGVIEVGMNHAGEIRALCAIAEPQVGVVTNVGHAHIEAFHSIEGIALAKRELIECLPPTGTAVLNADDDRVLRFRDIHPGPVLTYGLTAGAGVYAADVSLDAHGSSFSVNGIAFRTALTGRHGVQNVLAALAVATLFGIGFLELTGAVAAFTPGKMRGERHVFNGITVLNDSYNSNPDAARGMIDVLVQEPALRRIAVLGEMLELGSHSEQLHRAVGSYTAAAGVDVLIAVQGAGRHIIEAAAEAGTPGTSLFFFDDPQEAGVFLRQFVRSGDAVLFKGSRATQVEKALAAMES